MCTATWIRIEDGYAVRFNRDELSTRKPGLPPTVRERDGVKFLAPEDGDAGGTWLGVNELGVAIGLANGPRGERDEGPGPFRSRGLLVLDLLSSAGIEEVGTRIERMRGGDYRSFEVFAIEPPGESRVWRWDGETLANRQEVSEGKLLISSSRDPERARRERESLLERMIRTRGHLDEELLAAFHASHEPERGAFSPCMHREDASTVSSSRIRVGRVEAVFEYRPGSPCESRDRFVGRLVRDSA